MIKTVFYDLGNVLINIELDNSLRLFAAARPFACQPGCVAGTPSASGGGANEDRSLPGKIIEAFIDHPAHIKYERGLISSEEFFRLISLEYKLKMDFDIFRKTWCEIFTENKIETSRLLRVKEKVKIYLLSNTNEMHFEYIMKTYPSIAAAHGAVLSCRTGFRKPEKQIYEEALRIAGVRAEESVFVDDRPDNVAAACAVGIKAVVYDNKLKMSGGIEALI